MKNDERIQTTINRFAATGFWICYLLLTISLLYRTLILKQDIRDFWDIFAIWVIGIIFVFIAYANKGIFEHNFKRFWLTIAIVVIAVNIMLFFIKGQIHSVVDMGETVIGLLLGM